MLFIWNIGNHLLDEYDQSLLHQNVSFLWYISILYLRECAWIRHSDSIDFRCVIFIVLYISPILSDVPVH